MNSYLIIRSIKRFGILVVISILTLYVKNMLWIPDMQFKPAKTDASNINHIQIHYFNIPDFISTNAFSNCEYKCYMTVGRHISKDVGFVVFFGPRLPKYVPVKSNAQVWVLQSTESAANFKPYSPGWTGLFNWTISFRRDSDIPFNYGIFRRHHKTFNTTNFGNIWTQKEHKVAWFVSNCVARSKRQAFVNKLSKYIDVHIFGKCGKFKCPRGKESQCIAMLKQKYKFYLAFENSLCRDYITEKSFKVYQNLANTIPVTRGTNNYSLFLPKGSYINTDEFSSIKSLGEYLTNLTYNKEHFLKYLSWKKHYKAEFHLYSSFCELCKRAYNPDKYKRLYSNVNVWERGSYEKVKLGCVMPKDIK